MSSIAALVSNLELIFDNAMLYNARGSDYHKMASTLKGAVQQQHELYRLWYMNRQGHMQTQLPPLQSSETPPQPVRAEEAAAAEPPSEAREPAEPPVKMEEGASAAPAVRGSRKRAAGAPPPAAEAAAGGRRRRARE